MGRPTKRLRGNVIGFSLAGLPSESGTFGGFNLSPLVFSHSASIGPRDRPADGCIVATRADSGQGVFLAVLDQFTRLCLNIMMSDIISPMSNEEISNKDLSGMIKDLSELVESTARSTANILKNVAMKEDLEGLATKQDLADLRSELKTDIAGVDGKIISLHNRLDVNAGLDRRVEVLAKDIIEIKEHVGMQA